MQIRNPIYTADGRIDCEINHQKYGWVPYTASGASTDPDEKAIFDAAFDVNPAPYVAPPPPTPQPAIIPALTFEKLLIGLVAEGWITRAEGDAWLNGVLPTSVTLFIATLPVSQQFAATTLAKRPPVVRRNDGLVAIIVATQARTSAQIDAFFTTYAAI